MGTTGTGRFEVYWETSSFELKNQQNKNKCIEPLENVYLDDVGRSDFYKKHKDIPKVETQVKLLDKVIDGRLAVVIENTDEIVGFLPIEYNYLLRCINAGYSYIGKVVYSSLQPVPTVIVNLYTK